MNVIVTGSRHWSDTSYIYGALDALHAMRPIWRIVQGGARGVDRIAQDWADDRLIESITYPADWATYGRSAGPLRNKQMLEEGRPDLIVAFHPAIDRSKGTRHMVRIADEAGFEILLFSGTIPHDRSEG